MLAAYWFALSTLVVVVVFTAHAQYPESALGAALIIAAAWLPAFIWIRKEMGGLPIFPVFAVTYTWTFGLPLLYEHPIVKIFEATDQLFAAFTVAGFLLVATLVWYFVRSKHARPPTRCLLMRESGADGIFFLILATTILFTIVTNESTLNLAPGVFSILRAIILAIEALACVVLSFRLGTGQLKGLRAAIFKLLLLILVIVSLPCLLMINSMAIVALAAFGYVSGSGKVPWISFAAGILLFALLHVGKAEMRNRYWGDEDQGPVQLAEYPAFFTEWVTTSLDNLNSSVAKEENEHTLLERSSLMQILLYEQTLSAQLPFLFGDTYVILPALLIPRIFYPDKPAAHEGTFRLNIHYGFQTREQTETTTIGFGLLNEAYANFGLAGMGILAIVSGAFYGSVERWAAEAPLLSFRGLFAIIVASYSFQTEFAAGVYVAALFQSTIALLGLSLLILRFGRNPMRIQ
jgi:hypothetical protein